MEAEGLDHDMEMRLLIVQDVTTDGLWRIFERIVVINL